MCYKHEPMEQLIDALAVYRLTRLVQEDSLPPIVAMKQRAYERIDDDHPANELLDNCPWCLSFWMAILVLILRRTAPSAWRLLSRALAMSAIAGLLSERS